MKGLMAKDFALMKERGKILLFMLLWGFIMSFTMESASFVVGWIVLIGVISSTSSISYDEYDNCMPFIMSLPVTRKDYAVEKYVFSLAAGALCWLMSVVIVVVSGAIRGDLGSLRGEWTGLFSFLAVMVVILAITIPPQMKWGAEKGRMIFMAFGGVLFVAAFVFSRMEDRLSSIVTPMVTRLDSISLTGGIIGLILVCAVMLTISILISIRIMEKKEF